MNVDLEYFAKEDFAVSSNILWDLIEEHRPRREKMLKMYKAYKNESVPIMHREFADRTKINNKLVNPFRRDIVEQVVGYVFGEPIVYQIIPNMLNNEVHYERAADILTQFRLRNNLADLDSETGKLACICGYGARLAYIDTEGQEALMNVKPWEAIFVDDPSIEDVQYAMRYYYITDTDGEQRIKVEWYDRKNVTYYMEGPDGKFFIIGQQPHMFNFVPLIKFKNNDEEIGDFEPVESLIDAYDRLLSDAQNEIEEFRQAYMYFKGNVIIDEEMIRKARQNGCFVLPEGCDAGFLTKNINDSFVEKHKDALNNNIYKFSQSVDMQDEKFSESSGEARKWKLLALENKAIQKERKFTKALRQQFKVVCSSWEKKAIYIPYLAIDFAFNRNLPIDLKYLADSVTKFKGIVPDRKVLELLPFVDDVDAVLLEMQDAYQLPGDNIPVEDD